MFYSMLLDNPGNHSLSGFALSFNSKAHLLLSCFSLQAFPLWTFQHFASQSSLGSELTSNLNLLKAKKEQSPHLISPREQSEDCPTGENAQVPVSVVCILIPISQASHPISAKLTGWLWGLRGLFTTALSNICSCITHFWQFSWKIWLPLAMILSPMDFVSLECKNYD